MTDNTINNDMTVGGASGTLLANRYRVVKPLGQGGMGSVWLAEDQKLDGFKVAVKMLPSVLVNNGRAYQQVKAEALVSLKLSHPNIATVRAFEEEHGNPFLVMDYIDGQTLDDYLAEKGKLTEAETVKLLKPVAAALDYAHSQGVVHRDVKPGNIMIRKDGTPFVLDFGIAREIQETMTRVTGKLSSGTLLYMSPEQLHGAAPKPAHDIYSFAAMAYECLAGHPPFSRGQIEYQIEHDQPESLGPQFANCGPGVMAGLEKKSEMRPSSCRGVLEATRSRDGRREKPSPRPAHVTDGSRSSKMKLGWHWLWTMLVSLIIGLGVTFFVFRGMPLVYEAKSEIVVDMSRSEIISNGVEKAIDVCENTFNTYSSLWRSDKVVAKAVQQYRATHSASAVSDEAILSTLASLQLALRRNSRTVLITIRSKTPAFCAALANVYAEAIEAFTDEENKLRCDKAVSQIHSNVEKQRGVVDKVARNLLDFRTVNKVDNLRSSRETIQQGLSKTTADILALETEETQLIEWEKMLAQVQKDPASYGSLSVNVPRAQEIAMEFRAFQDADGAYQTLLCDKTDEHPEVVVKKKALQLAKQRFLDAAARALLTGRSTLMVTRNQLSNLKAKQEGLRNELAFVEQRIVLAESGLGQLEADFGVQNRLLEGLLLDENKARIDAEANNEIIRVGNPASVPTDPVLPNPTIVFGMGAAVSLLLGFIVAFVTSRQHGRNG